MPSQQSAKVRCERSGASAGQSGGSVCRLDELPHVHAATSTGWGPSAIESPAIIMSPAGNGCRVVGSTPGAGR